ncbi:hypothetical protein E1294_24955 [Nonomuraea diastatica]|uniref:Uncharacterized protein n=1 Tax=Nonomuraea diastatica TaxID=1848329 RepID=A0A4R4WNM2_9ACTN|nr:hypothetical protein E1294_24955 [Nonomuraea diastatica]
MTRPLSVADISSYLAMTGWSRQPVIWRGAAVWVHEGDHEILVPGTDDLGDAPPPERGCARPPGHARSAAFT